MLKEGTKCLDEIRCSLQDAVEANLPPKVLELTIGMPAIRYFQQELSVTTRSHTTAKIDKWGSWHTGWKIGFA